MNNMATKQPTNEKKKQTTQLELPAPVRGRMFEGTVTKQFQKRVVIEFERTVYIRKYERFYKKHSKIHARVPNGLIVQVGDYVRVQECRPLSKIIHAIVVEKVRSAGENKQ